MAYPANYRYTREHEWIELDGSIGAVGITDYAQNSLGDIVYVDMPKVGDTVTAGDTFGSVESVKAVSDLFSPVTGTVTAIINEDLKQAPDKLNEDPHGAWIIKVKVDDPTELEKLLDAPAYETFISEETGN
jgi:glycine cleavage system H protein